jgi:hypothetical protein
MDDDLHDALAVAHVDEQDTAVISLVRNPSAQRDLPANVLSAELAAAVGPHLLSHEPTSLGFTVS